MSTLKSRIMYIERKAESLNGPARIGRVTFSNTGRTVEYQGKKFQKSKSGYEWNHFEVATGNHYWISGPRRDGQDRLYAQSTRPVEIDEDVREELDADSQASRSDQTKTIKLTITGAFIRPKACVGNALGPPTRVLVSVERIYPLTTSRGCGLWNTQKLSG